jgi:hypothetical protein
MDMDNTSDDSGTSATTDAESHRRRRSESKETGKKMCKNVRYGVNSSNADDEEDEGDAVSKA